MKHYKDAEKLAADIVSAVGHKIVAGLPLGIGKATHVINALYALAEKDRGLELNILSALSLERPRASSALERRFLEPFAERHFDGYVDLDYVTAQRKNALPPNVHVAEFFLNTGAWLSNSGVQRHYISANYTAAPKVLLDRGVNLLCQLIAVDESGPAPRYSLAGNTDVTLDILPEIEARKARGEKIMFVGQVNRRLPFMPGNAELPAESFDAILDAPSVEFPPFAIPKRPVSTEEYVAGLHAASLVKDGGTIQIGIGALGDAVTYALILRQKENALFRDLISRLTDEPRETAPFEKGLYASSEMFVEGFLELYEAGILKREVEGGHVAHTAFFAGSHGFYERLRNMSEAERAKFSMTPVSFTNALYGEEERKRRDRVHARFMNNAMMVTLLGTAISDTLEDGRVVSGVGGQYEFVAQAHALEGARAALMLSSVRVSNDEPKSNILWNYGAVTVPRHLRDLVITEYGVADLRGQSDEECIARMLSVADARFQDTLFETALKAGKIGKDARPAAKDNLPGKLAAILAAPRAQGFFPDFPFGSDFTAEEQTALRALQKLKEAGSSKPALLRLFLAGLRSGKPSQDEAAALERLQLAQGGIANWLYSTLMKGGWVASRES